MRLETTPERSKNMQAIHSKDTKIEIKLRKALWHAGIHYRKNVKVINCRPDIVIKKYKLAIFCDGDFWHGRISEKYTIKNNGDYWKEKIKRNKERDLENTITLRDAGWTVLRFWEFEINNNLEDCVKSVKDVVDKKKRPRL